MLAELQLDNFKIWRSTGTIRLAPLTLLLGTNSSGKSSLIQSLLLIRQTVKSDEANIDLNFGNPDAADSVTMGKFKDVLCRHGAENEVLRSSQIGIQFRWSESGNAADSAIFTARYQMGYAGSAELDYLRIGKKTNGFIVRKAKPGIYSLKLSDQRKSLGKSPAFRPERSFTFSSATIAKLGERAEIIKSVSPSLLDELGRIIYLGPVRQLARRDYVWSGRMPASIGDDGGKAIDALIASAVAAKRGVKAAGDDASLFKETRRWLKKMDLADDISVNALGSSPRFELLIHRNGEKANVKDVGVGVSQVLPVIVSALFAKPGHIVIVEEPESHLHPLAQSLLAELFSVVSKERNVQFIVETHSEHLFRRMQTLMARQEVSADAAAMYFVERDGKAARMRQLELDDFGRVKNWPEGFFGDALGETREQTTLAIQRAKELRAKDGNVPN